MTPPDGGFDGADFQQPEHQGHGETVLCDVLVIGGGPAGATAGALLAKAGRDVIVVEKGAHPRFHIGESLLPQNMELFERLGLREQVHAMGVLKPGAEFIDEATERSTAFSFADATGATYHYAYQVQREEFDTMLFAAAARHGARTMQRVRVTDLSPPAADGRLIALALAEDGRTIRFSAGFVLDATGRDTFMAGRLGTRRANKLNTTAALFAHFRGVAPRKPELAGYITVHLVGDGWFWSIPLPDDVTSIGFVGDQSVFRGREGGMADLFAARIATSKSLSARLTNAERVTEVMSAGNYSYRADASWGDGYMMIGDAFAFVDPVFSSGVLLAMRTAERGARMATLWLESPERARDFAKRSERRLTRQMDQLNWLIYRINTPALRHMFLSPSNNLRMRDGLVSLLSGNFRAGPRTIGPVLAFKSLYHLLSTGERLFGPAVFSLGG